MILPCETDSDSLRLVPVLLEKGLASCTTVTTVAQLRAQRSATAAGAEFKTFDRPRVLAKQMRDTWRV